MKVEFWESEVFGPELVVSGSDFLEAKNNERELDSFTYALNAFLNLFDVEFRFGPEKYKHICNFLNKSSSVIFSIDGDDDGLWCNVYVSTDNQPTKIYGVDEDGHRTVRVKKLSQKAIDAKKKRIIERSRNV